MNHNQTTEETQERATLYALGALSQHEARAFRASGRFWNTAPNSRAGAFFGAPLPALGRGRVLRRPVCIQLQIHTPDRSGDCPATGKIGCSSERRRAAENHPDPGKNAGATTRSGPLGPDQPGFPSRSSGGSGIRTFGVRRGPVGYSQESLVGHGQSAAPSRGQGVSVVVYHHRSSQDQRGGDSNRCDRAKLHHHRRSKRRQQASGSGCNHSRAGRRLRAAYYANLRLGPSRMIVRSSGFSLPEQWELKGRTPTRPNPKPAP